MRIANLIAIGVLIILMPSCKSCKDKNSEETPAVTTSGEPSLDNTLGYGVLNKVKGIWNG